MFLECTKGVQIGGTLAGAGNVVAAGGGDGMVIQGSNATVQGNFVGTDRTGTPPGNTGNGVVIRDSV